MAEKVVINLSTGLEDAERVTVAFLVAGGAVEQGREVAMFLTKEAVRLALPGVATRSHVTAARRSRGSTSSSRRAAASCSYARSASTRKSLTKRSLSTTPGWPARLPYGSGSAMASDRLQLLTIRWVERARIKESLSLTMKRKCCEPSVLFVLVVCTLAFAGGAFAHRPVFVVVSGGGHESLSQAIRSSLPPIVARSATLVGRWAFTLRRCDGRRLRPSEPLILSLPKIEPPACSRFWLRTRGGSAVCAARSGVSSWHSVP